MHTDGNHGLLSLNYMCLEKHHVETISVSKLLIFGTSQATSVLGLCDNGMTMLNKSETTHSFNVSFFLYLAYHA